MATLTDEQKAERAAARRRKAALEAEADHERNEAKRREWRANGTYLTYEELLDGVPCRGCGLPVDDRLGSWFPTTQLTADERAEYDAADEDHRVRHAGCRAARWTLSGSRTQHCCHCCPPPPMSPGRIEDLQRLLRGILSAPRDLSTWRLTLTCGHTVEATQHRSYTTVQSRVTECQQCGCSRGVIEGEFLREGGIDKPKARSRRASVVMD